MKSRARGAVVPALLICLAACADRPTPLDPGALSSQPLTGISAQGNSSPAARHQRIARALARALRDEGFRAAIHRALSESAEPEGKVYLQRLLDGGNGAFRRLLAQLAGEAEVEITSALSQSAPIEIYLPVPEHRRAWTGGSDLLVATAETDRESPVAFDTQGHRHQLDASTPPVTPVLALVRAEQAFGGSGVSLSGTCLANCDDESASGDAGSGGGTTPVTPGLYMTYAKFNDTFEGWLKGSPEFEVHVLGQDGTSSAMKSYQCAGALAGAPYQYDQNDKLWSGRVMLFSQNQLDGFTAGHPGQAVRVFVVEDDDGTCEIKMDSTRVTNMFKNLKTAYGDFTGGKDKLLSIKTFTKAVSLLSFLKSAWSALTTQDDLIGNAIEDVVAREYFPGANWVVKGESTVTNGAIRLEMR